MKEPVHTLFKKKERGGERGRERERSSFSLGKKSTNKLWIDFGRPESLYKMLHNDVAWPFSLIVIKSLEPLINHKFATRHPSHMLVREREREREKIHAIFVHYVWPLKELTGLQSCLYISWVRLAHIHSPFSTEILSSNIFKTEEEESDWNGI